MHRLLKQPGYRLYPPNSPEAGALLAEQRLGPADLKQALARVESTERTPVRTIVGINQDGVFGVSRAGWPSDLPDACQEPFIPLLWLKVHELLGRVPEGQHGALHPGRHAAGRGAGDALRSVLAGRSASCTLARRASMQCTTRPRALSSCHSQGVSPLVSSSVRAGAAGNSARHLAIASGSVATRCATYASRLETRLEKSRMSLTVSGGMSATSWVGCFDSRYSAVSPAAEDVNDAERLARDPVMRAIIGREGLDRLAASSSQMGRFETEWLASDFNVETLTDLSGAWMDQIHARKPPRDIVLDMDSSESPTYGRQEGETWNGHFGCSCYHPLFVFNQFGDLERSLLRPATSTAPRTGGWCWSR